MASQDGIAYTSWMSTAWELGRTAEQTRWQSEQAMQGALRWHGWHLVAWHCMLSWAELLICPARHGHRSSNAQRVRCCCMPSRFSAWHSRVLLWPYRRCRYS